jgi:heat shock protein HslJ
MKTSSGALFIFMASLIPVAACGNTAGDPIRAGETSAHGDASIADTAEESGAADERSSAVPAELVGTWALVALDGEPVPEVGRTPTLEVLEDGSAGGLSGVNRYRTQLALSYGRLSFAPAAGTKMAGPPEAMALEDTFLARLGAVSAYRVEGDALRLWAGDNEALTFTRVKE